MGATWVCQWLLFFTLVAREGTFASMQSWKESQLLRCSQKRRDGLFPRSSTSMWQEQLHYLELHYPFYSFLASLSTTLCPPFLCTSSIPTKQPIPTTFSPLVPGVLLLYPKLIFLMLFPRLSQLFMEFLMPSCHWLCRMCSQRCSILPSSWLWSLAILA